jgi:energy-coupling factor transporter ATP-binding protein EcfA2
MYVRLAFAVAAHLEPEILVVDEVLAVGDIGFQRKSFAKMAEMVADQSKTILVVSHSIASLEKICGKFIWIDKGNIKKYAAKEVVLPAYVHAMLESASWERDVQDNISGGGEKFFVEKVVLFDTTMKPKATFQVNEDLTIAIYYHAVTPIERPHFIVGIGRRDGAVDSGSLFCASMLLDGQLPERLEGKGVLECKFKKLPLLPGTYYVDISIRNADGLTALVPPQAYINFSIASEPAEYGFQGEFALSMSRYTAPVVVDYEWHW